MNIHEDEDGQPGMRASIVRRMYTGGGSGMIHQSDAV